MQVNFVFEKKREKNDLNYVQSCIIYLVVFIQISCPLVVYDLRGVRKLLTVFHLLQKCMGGVCECVNK